MLKDQNVLILKVTESAHDTTRLAGVSGTL